MFRDKRPGHVVRGTIVSYKCSVILTYCYISFFLQLHAISRTRQSRQRSWIRALPCYHYINCNLNVSRRQSWGSSAASDCKRRLQVRSLLQLSVKCEFELLYLSYFCLLQTNLDIEFGHSIRNQLCEKGKTQCHSTRFPFSRILQGFSLTSERIEPTIVLRSEYSKKKRIKKKYIFLLLYFWRTFLYDNLCHT